MQEVNMKKSLDTLRIVGSNWEESQLLPKHATYVDAMNGFDGRPALRKAMFEAAGLPLDVTKAPQSVSGLTSGTTDLSLIPIYVDPTIVDLTRRLTPLVELFPRVTNYGRTADYNQLTARGIVGWTTEDAALDDKRDTYGRNSTAIRYCYQVGRVSGPMLAASRQYLSNQYIDALNLEVRNKTISMRYTEEDSLINGTGSARTGYGSASYAASTEPAGVISLISTNSDAQAGATITISALRQAIRKARTANESTTLGQGDPNLLVTDFKTLDDLKGLLQDFQRYVNTNFEIAWGIRTVEFEGLPVLASKWMPTTATARGLEVLSLDTWQIRVLQDVTYEELAKTNDSYKFMLKLYETFICTAEQFNAELTGLA
jgi:hypothetical protein